MSTKHQQSHTPEIPSTPLRFIWHVAGPHRKWLVAAIFAVITGSVLSQSTSYFFKLIVDAAEIGNTDRVFLYGLLFPVTILVVQLIFRFSGWLGMKSVTKIMKEGHDKMSSYTFLHSHGYFSDRFAGSIMTKYSNVVGAIGDIIPAMLWTHLTAFVSFLVTFIFILFVDLTTAGLFLALVLVLIVFNQRLAPKKRELSRVAAEARTKLNGKTIDALTNIQAVRQYARTEDENAAIRDLTEDRRVKHQRNWNFTEMTLLYNGFILFVFAMGMFWSLMTSWRAGDLTTGDLVLVLALVSQITGTLLFIGRAINETARSFGEMEEGLEDLVQPYEIIDASDAKELRIEHASIECQEVNFKYEENEVFANFQLHISPGQRIGLVGQSGAGKTTFVSLLLRQHELNSGQICIDGQNIATITQDSLRRNIAVVPQEPLLFHRSIRENIAYGKPSASEEEIVEVAKKAQAHDFITELPDGYDTLVGERGVKLSGGQKQRVAIARAMLKDAPILVLDEATSALDSESEVAIQQALEVLMEGRTVIAIAHRLSTLRKMDRIIVMESGEIIEDGTHDSLSAAGGTYERLWNHQAGGFLQED